MKNRKPETENGKPEIGPDRFFISGFPFSVSCFQFSSLFGCGSSGLGNAGMGVQEWPKESAQALD
jgi:hypothetical protein